MRAAVVDTSVLVADPAVLAEVRVPLAMSTVSLSELHLGVLAASSADVRARRLARLSRLQTGLTVLPVDEGVAEAYGRVADAVRRAGRSHRPRAFDLLIAATAVSVGAGLVTRNAADLKGAEQLVEILQL